MGSPVCPIVANLYLVSFEHRALTSAVNPPRLQTKYVDDTFVILQQSQRKIFCNTLTLWILPSTSPQKKPDKMVCCHSWTHP